MTTAHATRFHSSTSAGPDLGDALADFGQVRPRLLSIAHRIVGSWADVEDVVQDAWVRWQTCDRDAVLNPTAFLVTTTIRLAINAVQSAHSRRETCVGDWLPEPADSSDSPAIEAERGEALQQGARLVLERLARTERAAYVLRQAFDYPYPQIATLLRTSEANARQLASRAGKHVTVAQGRPIGAAEQQRFAHAFRVAARQGELSGLESLLTASDEADVRPPATTRSACRAPRPSSPRPSMRSRPCHPQPVSASGA